MAEKKEIKLPAGLKMKGNLLQATLCMPLAVIPLVRQQETLAPVNLAGDGDDAAAGQAPVAAAQSDFSPVPFRAISARYLGPFGYYLDFSRDGGKALKESIPLMLPVSAGGEAHTWLKFHANHQERIEARIGYIAAAEWAKADKQFSAPGINVTVMIHNELGARELTQLQTNPPLLDSVSLSFWMEWEQSHPDMDINEFWYMLGSEVEGDTVRIIVTKILDYAHLALVTEGADEEADRILVSNQNLSINTEVTEMDKLTFEAPQLKGLAGLLGVDAINTFQDLEHGITALISEGAANKLLAEKYQAALDKKRADLKAAIGKVDAESSLINLVEKMDWDSVDLLQTEYEAKLDAKFKNVCQKCGSTEVARRSSLEVNPVAGGEEPAGEKINASAYKTGKK